MINHYPWWKNLLIVLIIAICAVFALPNLYGEDPSVQISAKRDAQINNDLRFKIVDLLNQEKLDSKRIEIQENQLLVRFYDTEEQLKAADMIRKHLDSKDYVVALNLAADTPQWAQDLGLSPMFLGLDLRGGVHFLMEVDSVAVDQQMEEGYMDQISTTFADVKQAIPEVSRQADGSINVKFSDQAAQEAGEPLIKKDLPNLIWKNTNALTLNAAIREEERREKHAAAAEQNRATLANRVNELGVAEPIIQQQGENRIVVQLPGVQDTARAKEILGTTATLEFRMVSRSATSPNAVASGQVRAPLGTQLFYGRNGQPYLLERKVIIKGDSIIDASSQQSSDNPGTHEVNIVLDGKGAAAIAKASRENIGHLLATLFIENKTETMEVGDQEIRKNFTTSEVINAATIQTELGKRFRITGQNSAVEARNLALLLRAGSLAAPINIVEERTVGPSAGKENIQSGIKASVYGLLAVMVFMVLRYRTFGFIACIALVANLVILVAVMSMIHATLTMPGIAGIVLTLGMAVDANVLIYERIREELRLGRSAQLAIEAGYNRAFATILDTNITTIIASLVLFGVGSGPIKGFALTLTLGTLISMFTAIQCSRAIVNIIWGQRRGNQLPV